ncbi:MAG TPA: nucleotidyltransferase domain-containing protein, partial [Elusimicrobia bacterium]|nr:nucleotidyltransferase domain-containing protein [Elusimicrobiota bacterium]
ESTKYSDWDFLVIVKKDITLKEKRKIAKAIREKLADSYIPCDVIVKSEKEIEYYKDFVGTATREALKEGVSL